VIIVFVLLLLVLLAGVFVEFMESIPWLFAIVILIPSIILGSRAAKETRNSGPNAVLFSVFLFFSGWFGLRALFLLVERVLES
jgi:hypothetical protein